MYSANTGVGKHDSHTGELRQCIHTIIKIETSVKVRLTLLTDSSILFWGESPNPCASYMLIFATYRPKEHKFY